jgi:hypothetical protein
MYLFAVPEVASSQFGAVSQFPQGQYPPPQSFQFATVQGQYPTGQFPQQQFVQGQFPTGQYPPGQYPPNKPGTFQVGNTSAFLWSKNFQLPLEKQEEVCGEAGNLITSNHSCTLVCGFTVEIDGVQRHALYIRLGWRFRNQTLLKNMGKLRYVNVRCIFIVKHISYNS